jgi:hypothetical protein
MDKVVDGRKIGHVHAWLIGGYAWYHRGHFLGDMVDETGQ